MLVDDKVSRHHGQMSIRLGMLVYTTWAAPMAQPQRHAVTESLSPGTSSNWAAHGDDRADLLTFTSRMDVFTLSLWALRLGFLLLVYVFFFLVARALWHDLRAGVMGAGRPLARLIVIAAPEGKPEAGSSIPLDAATLSAATSTTRSSSTIRSSPPIMPC